MSLLHNRQPQPKVNPVHGACRWVVPLGDADAGVLEIRRGQRADLYEVVAFREEGILVGFRLNKLTGGKEALYDVDTRSEPWRCDCADAVYRERQCKHVLALKAALAALGR